MGYNLRNKLDKMRNKNKNKNNDENYIDDETYGDYDSNKSEENENQSSIKFENFSSEDNNEVKKGFSSTKIFIGFTVIVFLISFNMFGSTQPAEMTNETLNAIETRVSNELPPGTILFSQDESAEMKDYTIEHSSNENETKIYVWDYAAEDGDYVQILVNGVEYTDAFMILNESKVFTVPSTGEIQVKGIKDGGGGITYAAYYDVNSTIYFNSAPEGECNTYTLLNK